VIFVSAAFADRRVHDLSARAGIRCEPGRLLAEIELIVSCGESFILTVPQVLWNGTSDPGTNGESWRCFALAAGSECVAIRIHLRPPC
jgi:hypothetical protein